MNSAKTDIWAAIKADYLAGALTVSAVAKKHGRSRAAIYRHATSQNWQKRQRPRQTSRAGLIDRLMTLLERQLGFMEMNMTGTDDKEVALLGNMVRTLEKLIDLDRKGETAGDDARQDRNMTELRDKLAARIDQLRQG